MLSLWKKCLLIFGFVCFAVMNSVGGQEISYFMPAATDYNNYGMAFYYSICMFGLTTIETRGHPLEQFKWFFHAKGRFRVAFVLGQWAMLYNVFQQSTVPYVDPMLESVLGLMTIPCVWILHFFVFPEVPLTYRQCVAILIVLFGLLFAPVYYNATRPPPDALPNSNNIFKLILFISIIFQSCQIVHQEHFIKRRHAPIFPTLALYNLLSVPGMFLWKLTAMTKTFGNCWVGHPDAAHCTLHACHIHELLPKAWDSVKCSFGVQGIDCCQNDTFFSAPFWCAVYVIGYVGWYSTMSLIQREPDGGSGLVAISFSIATPLSSMAYWLPPAIVYTGHQDFASTKLYLASLAFIVIGSLIYEKPNLLPEWWESDIKERQVPKVLLKFVHDLLDQPFSTFLDCEDIDEECEEGPIIPEESERLLSGSHLHDDDHHHHGHTDVSVQNGSSSRFHHHDMHLPIAAIH